MASNPKSDRGTNAGGKIRKPYQPPRILSRERLESAANVCIGFGMKAQPQAPSPWGSECGAVSLFS
jgi:hypothetical protein